MRTTIHTGEPSSPTTRPTENTENRVAYDVGFALIVLLFVLILIYTSYMCNRIKRSRSPPPPPPATSDSDTDDLHSTTLSVRLEDHVLSTFPTFVYSDIVKETHAVACGSGCAICLGDYKAPEVVRLLPECGHLFHCKCIDTWLKVHPTCPVCRSSPAPELSHVELTHI